jgi:3-deoxy-D-manno-octulosonic-acid transferase
MPTPYDLIYKLGLWGTSPLWWSMPKARAKVRDALSTRSGHVGQREGKQPALLLHAVSMGELNAARTLIDLLRSSRPDLHLIITTTTTTGHARALELFGNRDGFTVLRFPIDLSGAIQTMLDALRPDVVVLMELEVWPNFLSICRKRNIPVVIANGRITAPSFRKYKLLGPLCKSMFRKLRFVCAQDHVYADRFQQLGVAPENLHTLGTMKFDSATISDRIEGDTELALDMGIDRTRPLLVAGSTGPGEEAMLIDVYKKLLARFPDLQLALIPRKPERFNEVAELITASGFACIRRSENRPVTDAITSAKSDIGYRKSEIDSRSPFDSKSQITDGGPALRDRKSQIFLGDTMGELKKFYSLATLVFVGRSLVDLGPKNHGSDMIEPAALAKPTIVGPHTGNFEEPMRALLAGNAITVVQTADHLTTTLTHWLQNPTHAQGHRAQQVVASQLGSSQRHLELLLPLLPPQ